MPRRNIPPEVRAIARSRYEQDEPVLRIAEALGVGAATIHRWAKTEGWMRHQYRADDTLPVLVAAPAVPARTATEERLLHCRREAAAAAETAVRVREAAGLVLSSFVPQGELDIDNPFTWMSHENRISMLKAASTLYATLGRAAAHLADTAAAAEAAVGPLAITDGTGPTISEIFDEDDIDAAVIYDLLKRPPA